jgi:hypothetical protein
MNGPRPTLFLVFLTQISAKFRHLPTSELHTMGIAKTCLLLQSTVATLAGLALLFYPASIDHVVAQVVTSGSKAALAQILIPFGGIFILLGAVFCTAAGAVNPAILRSVSMGNLAAAAAFGWIWYQANVANAKTYLDANFVLGGAAYFAAAGLITLVLPAGSKSKQN